MSHHFFLSCERSDNDQLVRRFFKDLSVTIRDGLNLSLTQSVGFYEETENGPTSAWSSAAEEALKNSRMMVSLLSPSYLRSERAGKEWQIFETRRRLHLNQPELEEKSLDQVIVPVTWISCPGPLPRVVAELLAQPDRLYQRRPMMTMFRSSAIFKGEYSELVKSLASRIIDVAAKTDLLPLEPLPAMNDVQSAFQLWDETVSTSDESREQSKCHKSNHPDVELIKAEQRKEGAPTSSNAGVASLSSSQSQSESVFQSEAQTTRYSVYAISDNSEVLELIEECCGFNSDFDDLTICDNIAQARRYIKKCVDDDQELPDLFVIDVDVGISIVEVLTVLENLTPETLGLSGSGAEQNPEHKLIQQMPILPKPPVSSRNEIIDQIRQLAIIGRKRAVYKGTIAHDPTRQRKVFVSFFHEEKELANRLRKSLLAFRIDTSHSADIQKGDDWQKAITRWLAQAQVLLPLISNGYLGSKWCRSELTSFGERVKPNKRLPMIIPMYYELQNTSDDQLIKEYVERLHHFDVSDSDLPIKELVKSIHDALRNNPGGA